MPGFPSSGELGYGPYHTAVVAQDGNRYNSTPSRKGGVRSPDERVRVLRLPQGNPGSRCDMDSEMRGRCQDLLTRITLLQDSL